MAMRLWDSVLQCTGILLTSGRSGSCLHLCTPRPPAPGYRSQQVPGRHADKPSAPTLAQGSSWSSPTDWMASEAAVRRAARHAGFYNLSQEALGYIDVSRNQTDRLPKVFRYIVTRNPILASQRSTCYPPRTGTACRCTYCLFDECIVDFCFFSFLNINGASEENVLVPSVIQIK